MQHTKELVYRAVEDFEDHKVIQVKQMNGSMPHLHHYKLHKYVRADIVEKMIDAYADLRVENVYDTGGHYGGLTHEQELQLEKNRIFGILGLNK